MEELGRVKGQRRVGEGERVGYGGYGGSGRGRWSGFWEGGWGLSPGAPRSTSRTPAPASWRTASGRSWLSTRRRRCCRSAGSGAGGEGGGRGQRGRERRVGGTGSRSHLSPVSVDSYLAHSDGEDLPAGHAVLHLVVLGPLSGQRLRLLDLKAKRNQSVYWYELNSVLLLLTGCVLADLKRLVLPPQLLHGCCRVVQLPPQLHHLRLQLLDLAFTFYTTRETHNAPQHMAFVTVFGFFPFIFCYKK